MTIFVWVILGVCEGAMPENPLIGGQFFNTREEAIEYVASNPATEDCIYKMYGASLDEMPIEATNDNPEETPK